MFAFQKTPDGNGESYRSEVFFMRSKNLLSLHEKDVLTLNTENRKGDQNFVCETTWETLPYGEHGLQTNLGLKLGEEPHLLQILRSRLMCFWRTDLGFLDSSYSDDYGESWTPTLIQKPLSLNQEQQSSRKKKYNVQNNPIEHGNNYTETNKDNSSESTNELLVSNRAQYLSSPAYLRDVISNHNILRNPRGAITPIQLSDDYYALLFYNNGHTEKVGYVGRLVYWLTLGIASKDNRFIVWSQPEIVLWWDGILLDDRENWNEDWAIVDGAGYADFQELENGNLVFVESNKLTVRYHEISASILTTMKKQLLRKNDKSLDGGKVELSRNLASSYRQKILNKYKDDVVYVYKKYMGLSPPVRAPVLPDLRSGGGFSFIFWINLSKLIIGNTDKKEKKYTLVNGMSTVSGALDEEHAADIDKGYEIVFTEDGKLYLFITDGFKTTFHFEIEFSSTADDHYGVKSNKLSMVSFIVDGGPKVASCVINDRLYNAAPSGWKFFPRELGEIGGSNVDVNQNLVEAYVIFDKALLTSECIDIYQTAPYTK